MKSKFNLKSKTVWLGLITALASFYPPAMEFLATNAQTLTLVWSLLTLVLRSLTKGGITLLP